MKPNLTPYNTPGRLMTAIDYFSVILVNFQQSMGLISVLSPLIMVALLYKDYFEPYIRFTNFLILAAVFIIIFQIIYYKYLYPGLIRVNSKLAWVNKNPMKDAIMISITQNEEINKRLDRIEKQRSDNP